MEYLVFGCVITFLVLLERVPWIRFESLPVFRRWFASDLLFLATGVLGLGALLRGAAADSVGLLAVPGLDAARLSTVPAVLLALVVHDLGAYLAHYLLHRVEALWRTHQVHHSSPSLDWLATFRAHPIEHALRHLLSPVALLLLGFSPPVVALAAAIYGAWAAFGHSNFRPRLGFLEPLMITPRLHRLHHVPRTSEQNLGTVFSLWDRLRGTLVTDPAAPLSPIGVPGEVTTYPQGWGRQLLEPLRPRPAA